MESKIKGRLYVNFTPYYFDLTREDGKVIEIDFPDEFHKTSHPVFKAIERYFDDWIDQQRQDTKDQYFLSCEELDGHTYCSKKEAIRGGLEIISEYMIENNYLFLYLNEKSFGHMDMDGYFQP
jgi:hypothetical protein